jgi:hypothetical protein
VSAPEPKLAPMTSQINAQLALALAAEHRRRNGFKLTH